MHTKTMTRKATAKTLPCDQTAPAPPGPSDEELLLDYAKTGNQEAFAQLVRRYERDLYGYLRRCLGDAQLAEDAFQNTFLQLHRKCGQFEAGRRLRPWLYAIAHNQVVDLLRRDRRRKTHSLNAAPHDAGEKQQPYGDLLEADAVDPGERLKLREDCERTRRAMGRVPAKVRQVLTLVVYQGLPYREAAKVLGIPLGTVKSRMYYALQSLHGALVATREGPLQVGGDQSLIPKG
jgi:RNA polymerase sigma-70 factor, ECF subfamily